jgi:hypothetical protein
LVHCFGYVLNLGFRSGGGIGDAMNAVASNYKYYDGLWAVQFLFFLIVNIIFLNVIFGIIIDTFSYLRELQDMRDDDIANVCFVCGNSRFDFSKKNKDFQQHKDSEHDPWQYVAFLYHMNEIGETDLNGLETSAWNSFEKRETDWLPIGDTVYLNNIDEVDSMGKIEEKVSDIYQWLNLFQENYLETKGGMSKSIRNNKSKRTLMGFPPEKIQQIMEDGMPEEPQCENIKN